MAYTTINKGSDYFNTVLYTGTGATLSITGVGFQPDFVWTKGRSVAFSNYLMDSVRGVGKRLISNSASNEDVSIFGVSSFNSDGFTLGTDTGANNSGSTFVGWNWLASNTTTSNTSGTITSTVSVNQTAGFSIVSYTGTGSAGATIGHGLGAVPRMIIVKNRDASDAWQVYHAANTSAPETDYLVLNTTAATADNINRWNDTLPTSTLFSIGDGVEVNTNTEKYIAYCFAEVKGYSKFGSYTGNGSTNGTFIYTGFKPAFIMHKRTDDVGSWFIFDSKRIGYNAENYRLIADTNNAEADPGEYDILSNGVKIRFTSGNVNASGGTYIYMAFAENPFVTSSGIPVTAR
jgi:hypothetical protein